MKSLLGSIALVTVTLIAATLPAEARSHRKSAYSTSVYVSGYRSCGTPIYKQRYIIRYERCGTPVWGCRVVAPPRRYHAPPPRVYCPPVPVCPPPPCYDGYRRSGVVIEGRFRL